MASDAPVPDTPQSPFDPYVSQLMSLIASNDQISSSTLAQVCVGELHWLPGFCDVIIHMLRANGLIQVFEWEPGKLHISDRGRRWLQTSQESVTVR
jgi:hypothetical protein